MAIPTNEAFEEFWERRQALILTNVAAGGIKLACHAAFIEGEMTQIKKSMGREALDGSAAHASSGQPAPRA